MGLFRKPELYVEWFLHNLAYKIPRIQLQFITFLLNLRNYASLLLKITYQIDKSINKGCISKNFKEQTTSITHVFHTSRFQTSNEWLKIIHKPIKASLKFVVLKFFQVANLKIFFTQYYKITEWAVVSAVVENQCPLILRSNTGHNRVKIFLKSRVN